MASVLFFVLSLFFGFSFLFYLIQSLIKSCRDNSRYTYILSAIITALLFASLLMKVNPQDYYFH